MKALWFSHSAGGGGAELCLAEAVAALGERGVRCVVAFPEDGPLVRRVAEAGGETRVSRYGAWLADRGSLAGRARRAAGHAARWRGLARLVRSVAPDVVVTNTLVSPGGALAARAAGVPHVWFVHEFGREDHGFSFDLGFAATAALVDRLSARVLVASGALRDHLAGRIGASKLRTVAQAVEVDPRAARRRPAAAGAPMELLVAGRKHPGKGQEDAVRAVALLAARGVDVRLTLLGAGLPSYAERLRALARGLGVEGRVRDAAFTPEPAQAMADADAVLVCSRLEAFGRVTVEAMKVGTPVVGAASGGTAELIRHGWNGLLFPVGDAAALADAVQALHRDPSLRAALADNARRWAIPAFTRARFGAELEAVLAEAAGAAPPALSAGARR